MKSLQTLKKCGNTRTLRGSEDNANTIVDILEKKLFSPNEGINNRKFKLEMTVQVNNYLQLGTHAEPEEITLFEQNK
ncbi:hypothetical protein PR048_015762 [Dryococelus australis]|uniref:Uncharacterized protein n=1 Tax=Dryococelus australis TaxID=614101 RepID=A0ABQ9HHV2_9NEOP|nr:hypothetical protein PR048_015762 [Dryococelus australis]